MVICVDGCAGEYLALGFANGELPHLAKLAASGHYGQARGALPSFTNVNNCAMVTGTPPSQTGIGGNYILDPDTGEEVMTNSSRFLRNDTILAAASAAGRRVAMVTAKDKLRELLSKGMDGIAVSAEKANDVLHVDDLGEYLTAILAVVQLQLLAYHIATLKGTDVDQPRNLAKSVTVE